MHKAVLAALMLLGAGVSQGATAALGGTLTVIKILVPAGDPGRFNLRIDGIDRALSVGNNGTTGSISVFPGAHTVSEIPAPGSGVNPADYVTTVSGACNAGGGVQLFLGQHKTCTITNTRKPAGSHGSWIKGPGIHSFTVCSSGTQCTLVAPAGQPIPIKIETWGGGGGGGGGGNAQAYGGDGGGGGGGGGYATTTVTVVPSSGTLTYYVWVGDGGIGGKTIDPLALRQGGPGGRTYVRQGSSTGQSVLQADGGAGGQTGTPIAYGYPGGAGGAAGSGTVNGWSGTVGYHGGLVTGCNGGGGGLGGAGGGPGRTGPGYVNDGGNGGHGGYYNGGIFSCNSHGMDYLLSEGVPGGSGKVNFSW